MANGVCSAVALKNLRRPRSALLPAGLSALCLTLAACSSSGADPTPAEPDVAAPAAAASVTPSPEEAPAAQPAASESADERYAQAVASELNAIRATAERTAAIMERVEIDSPAWREELLAALAWFGEAAARAQRLTPSPAFEPVQVKLIQATADFEHAAALFTAGLDEFDLTKIEQASELFTLGALALTQSTVLLSDVQTEIGIQ